MGMRGPSSTPPAQPCMQKMLKTTSPFLLCGLALLTVGLLPNFTCRRNDAERIVPATAPLSVEALKHHLHSDALRRVRTLAAHARLSIEGGDVAAEASANLLWVRDSVLWMNVKKYGMEISRILVTADSFFVLNRIDKTAQVGTRQALLRQYHLPEELPLLPYLLLAEAWLPQEAALQANIKDSLHCLRGTAVGAVMDYYIEEGRFRLRRSTFLQPERGQWLSQHFARFRKLPRVGVFFPYFRRLELFSPESGYVRIDIDFTQIDINVDKPFRFDIPDYYQRISP